MVFIEGNVPDAALLAQSVARGVTAVVLDPERDGVLQIAGYLAKNAISDLAAINIVAHGANGSLSLGSVQLNDASFGRYDARLAAIGAALAAGGAIQLYGCDVAENVAGVAFLQQLSAAAGGVAVAAASHLVGAASGGGNWTLDVDVGVVSAATPFAATVEAAYPAELASTTDQLVYWAGGDSFDNPAAIEVGQIGIDGSNVNGVTDIADASATSNLLYNAPGQIALDTPQNRYLLAENFGSASGGPNVIVEGSLNGGSPSVVYTEPYDSNGTIGDAIGRIGGIAFDAQTGQVYFSASAYDGTTGLTIPADTGIYKSAIGTGGTLSASKVTSSINTLVNPLAVAVDAAANLLFLIDSYPISTTSSLNNVDEVNLTTGAMATVYSFPTSNPFLSLVGLAVDPTRNMLFVATQEDDYNDTSPLSTPSSLGNSIVAIPFTVSGTGSSANAVAGSATTLYSGSAADVPYSLAVDPATQSLYVGGIVNPTSTSFYGGVFKGNEVGSTPLAQITDTGAIEGTTAGQTSRLYSMAIYGHPAIMAGATVAVQAGAGPVVADAALTVRDMDDVIANATVTGVLNGDSLSLNNGSPLTFNDGGTISSSFALGTLCLSGNASASDYTRALDQVKISTINTAANARTLTWTVSNGVNAAADTSRVLCSRSGSSDILFRNNTTGDMGWIDGITSAWHDFGGTLPIYSVVGVGDYNGGTSDSIMFRNAAGDFGYIANLDGPPAWVDLGPSNPAFSVVGTGDFTGNGISDVLFRNSSTGDTGIIMLNASGVTGWNDIGTIAPSMSVVAIGDFTGDGADDIFFENTANGDVANYQIAQGKLSSSWTPLLPFNPNYSIVGVADFSGDGTDDLLAINKTTGDMGFVAMPAGGGQPTWVDLGPTSTAYAALAVGDFASNGGCDILFRNATTGDTGYVAVARGTNAVSWHDIGTTLMSYSAIASSTYA